MIAFVIAVSVIAVLLGLVLVSQIERIAKASELLAGLAALEHSDREDR